MLRRPVLAAGSATSFSRRRVLLGALASSAWGCQAGDILGPPQRPTTASAAGGSSAAPPGALDVVRLGPLRDEEKGGLLVVLLHGWRAPNARVAASRRAVQALLSFSQGAMLALDVALAADPPVDRVAVLSGVLLADSLPALQLQRAAPAVFVSHGRSDSVLPFDGGASIQKVLVRHGVPVTFFPFDGGHEIPPVVVAQLRTFLLG